MTEWQGKKESNREIISECMCVNVFVFSLNTSNCNKYEVSGLVTLTEHKIKE